MTAQVVYVDRTMPVVIKLHPGVAMTDEQFFEFCQINSEY